MNDEGRCRAEELFEQLCMLPPDQREAALAQACGDDTAVRTEVQSLLREYDGLGDFLEGLVRPPAAPPQSWVGRKLGPYQIEEVIGAGGQGVVFRASRIDDYQQQVAVKLVWPTNLSPASVERFHRERQVLARLEHPHITRILDGGCTPDGQPYFVMEHLPGPSLRDLAVGAQLPTPREAAGLLSLLADAVHHAHEHGVLHRDLKPHNVLLDATGQPRITDFGLAKLLASARESSAGPSDELTHTGQVVGTPAYMPPEQARGSGASGPAGDVYSLGAILYFLLTGRPPFQGTTWEVLRQQVVEQDPVSPRRLTAGTPRDLETICLKCLWKEPRGRYQTARELADDLRRYQQGRPILARPLGPVARMWLWGRRNPVTAGLSASLGLVVLVSLLGLTWLWREADSERRQAEHNLDNFRRFVRVYFVPISRLEDELSPSTRKQQIQLLRPAQRYFEDFLTRYEDHEGLRLEVAESLLCLGQISAQIGTTQEAIAAYERARDHYDRLPQQRKAEHDIEKQLAEIHHQLAVSRRRLGLAKEAEQSFTKAMEVQQRLADSHPQELAVRRALATTCFHFASFWQFERRDLPQAEKLHRQALAWREDLVGRDGRSPQLRRELSASHVNLGTLLWRKGQPAEGEKHFDRARELLERLQLEYPGNSRFQHDLAGVHAQRANLLARDRLRFPEALRLHQQAFEIRERVAAWHPDVVEYQVSLYHSRINQAKVHEDAKQWSEARLLNEAALAVIERLAQDDPGRLDFQRLLGITHHNAATVLRLRGQSAGSLEHYRKAEAIRQRLTKIMPNSSADAQDLLKTRSDLAQLQQQLAGQDAEAILLASLNKAREDRQRGEALRGKTGDTAEGPHVLGGLWHWEGELLAKLGRWDEAEAAFRKAAEHQQEAVKRLPERRLYREFLEKHRASEELARQRARAARRD